jgi:hypothetical protein
MKDLIPNDVVELSKTEIIKSINKAENTESLEILKAVKAVGTKKKTMRNKVRKTLSTLSADGKSLAKLHEIELVMNCLKVEKLIDDMKSLKSCIEWVFNDLVKDDSQPFFQKENRQSMKNVEINTLQPCVMSPMLKPKVKPKAEIVEDISDIDLKINLTADNDNKFQSKNKIFFESHCELDENNELVINDETFNATMELFKAFQSEIRKARLNAIKVKAK